MDDETKKEGTQQEKDNKEKTRAKERKELLFCHVTETVTAIKMMLKRISRSMPHTQQLRVINPKQFIGNKTTILSCLPAYNDFVIRSSPPLFLSITVIIINVLMISGCFHSPTCWLTGLVVSSSLLSNIAGVLGANLNKRRSRKTWPSPPCRSLSALALYFSLILLSVCRLHSAVAGSTSVAFPCLPYFDFPLFLFLSPDLSFSLALSNCLCLPLSVSLSVLFPKLFPLLA